MQIGQVVSVKLGVAVHGRNFWQVHRGTFGLKKGEYAAKVVQTSMTNKVTILLIMQYLIAI
jgi:hypothetical protein